jgi:hypothetical protein
MKKALILTCILIFCQYCFAQVAKIPEPNVAFKWAPTGLLLGSLSLQAEYSFAPKHSLTAKIGVPVKTRHQFEYEGDNADFDMRATSFMAGYRTYLSRRSKMQGIYLEPFFKYVHHTSEGFSTGRLNYQDVEWNFTNDYNAYGIGLQLGAQFIIGKHLTIDLFLLGPEINKASNNFKAIDISQSLPWSPIESREAEKDIREFLDQFPFLHNNVDVLINSSDKTVNAKFNGALPGLRTGISFGFAF